jgi:hypothetical protein
MVPALCLRAAHAEEPGRTAILVTDPARLYGYPDWP